MSNWKNVNNWHWTSKNCTKWANEHLSAELKQLSAENDGISVTIDDLREFSGDVDLSQRKGKVITIYDVKLEIAWSGTGADDSKVEGTICIPEMENDIDVDDYEYNVSIENESSDNRVFKDVVQQHLIPLLKTKLRSFSKDLISTHTKDIYINPEEMGQSTPPRAATPISAASESPTPKTIASASSNTVSATIINTKTITDTVELQTSADQVYETLLDPGRVAAWTRARPDVFRNVGSHFSLFDGNITGTMLELVPNKKIVQTWRLKTWPEEHHSKVSMTLEQTSEATKVHVKHEGVPIGEEDVIRGNWQTFYWNPIKSVFGYGSVPSTATPSSRKARQKRKSSKGDRGRGSRDSAGNVGFSITAVVVVLTALFFGYLYRSSS